MEKSLEITILDGLETNPGDLSWEPIYKHGILTVYDDFITDEDEIVKRIGNSEVVISVDTPITKNILSKCRNIRYIGAMATGYNHIDIEEADRRGIVVTNVPSYSTSSVAKRTIALLLELSDRVGDLNRIVKEGKWSVPFHHWEIPSFSLENKKMGILGYGNIGKETAKVAKALGMDVLAYSRSNKEGKDEMVSFVSFSDLLSLSDFISLHLPLTVETHHIINEETIGKMKDGVVLINTSRGSLIDEKALFFALKSGKIAAAGLDVMENEPVQNSPLFSLNNTIITPHSAWTGKEAREKLIKETGENLEAFLEGRERNRISGKGEQ